MSSYWEQRSIESIGRMESAVNGALPELVKSFEQAKRDLNNEVFKFYGKYAVNNKVSMEEAEKLLSLSELREFRGNLKEFEKLSRESIGTFNLQVANLSTKARITRLQALYTQCDAVLQKLYQEQKKQIEKTATSVLNQQYYHQLFNIEQYTGFQFRFSKLATSVIEQVISQPVQGADISTHLWRQDIDCGFRIRQTLNQMFVTGRPPQDFADELQKAIGAIRVDANGVKGAGKKFEAYRLLYTESAHSSAQADLKAYENDGLNEYEYIATLDSHTSEMCREHDGKIYKRSEAVTGVNFPPLHVFCRSTTAPHIPNLNEIKSTRMARDENGNSVRVPQQTYEEWAKGKKI